MKLTLLGLVLVLYCLHANALINTDQAIVFVTSAAHGGDLSGNPCETAVLMSGTLADYTAGYSIFPLVASTTTNYRDLLPAITTVFDVYGFGPPIRTWTSIYDNWPHLEYMLYDDSGNPVDVGTPFWTGADFSASGAHDGSNDCDGFTSSSASYTGNVIDSTLQLSTFSTVGCNTPARVLCAITHPPPTPSAIIASSASISPVPTTSPSPTSSQQVCSRL
jgi:hypothetical protein